MEYTVRSLMDSFDFELSHLANQFTFDERTWVVTLQLTNADDFLDRVEAELGFVGNDDPSLDGSVNGSKNPINQDLC
jgi:hypothetical protein